LTKGALQKQSKNEPHDFSSLKPTFMKKFLPIFIAALLALPATAQRSARESHQAMRDQIQIEAEASGKNFHFPATASHNQSIHFSTLHLPRVKNTRVLMQKMDSYVSQNYNAFTSSWINSNKSEFAYDGDGNNTSDIVYNWNPGTGLFEILFKQEFTYANGNLTESVYYQWDAGNNIYLQDERSTYTYNEDGYLTIAHNYYWNGSAWLMKTKFEWTWDAEGKMIQHIFTMWDSSTNGWINHIKTENSYNGSGALLVSNSKYWDLVSGSWVNASKVEYTYNGIGQMITSTHSSWHPVNNQWFNSFKLEYTYDGNMNLVMRLQWNWDGAQWLTSYKLEHAYNNAYTSNEILMPQMFMGESVTMMMHMLTGITEYGYSGQSFVMQGRNLYNYSQVNLNAIAQHETSKARIYPQPANDRVTFSWDTHQPTLELSIYDLNGKEALSQQLDNHGSVSVDQLKPGLYFYRLAGNNQTFHTGKLSVR
jgi:hypothetical protein